MTEEQGRFSKASGTSKQRSDASAEFGVLRMSDVTHTSFAIHDRDPLSETRTPSGSFGIRESRAALSHVVSSSSVFPFCRRLDAALCLFVQHIELGLLHHH